MRYIPRDSHGNEIEVKSWHGQGEEHAVYVSLASIDLYVCGWVHVYACSVRTCVRVNWWDNCLFFISSQMANKVHHTVQYHSLQHRTVQYITVQSSSVQYHKSLHILRIAPGSSAVVWTRCPWTRSHSCPCEGCPRCTSCLRRLSCGPGRCTYRWTARPRGRLSWVDGNVRNNTVRYGVIRCRGLGRCTYVHCHMDCRLMLIECTYDWRKDIRLQHDRTSAYSSSHHKWQTKCIMQYSTILFSIAQCSTLLCSLIQYRAKQVSAAWCTTE